MGEAHYLEHEVHGWAARDCSGVLSPFKFSRRATGPRDVTFKVLYCGICHSDLHQIRNEWQNSKYPMVPGHEFVGIVTEIGPEVHQHKVGDHVGVGCMVGSCQNCDSCAKGAEQYCECMTPTYNDVDQDGKPTYGGYSALMVCDERFVLQIPKSLPLDAAAPLLCAGITVYSPLRYFGMDEAGKSLGVVGLGGLGHMAVKFGKAFGMNVTVISTSPSKEEEARLILNADNFLVSKNDQQMKKAVKTLDYIIDTVSAKHELEPLLSLLKVNGKLVLVGGPEEPLQLNPFAILFGRKTVAGSTIGGIKETQDMLDFCGVHNLISTIETIPFEYVNKAMDRLAKSDVKYRFVIDVANTL
ncbi:hypothetical protein O6H91_21G031700 [Diphasiastrum complanatum]|uniref:Uncharacterized protein n=3 Tax=Diphasiastrum complanatum TaxID=34168 RepID=A0ACC2AJB6_DIPCM|nr:hypothetical protein O6H91_21G031700 [Diphasiastrum complanatum]KAJ7517615.1 hypothetical protein O6H91_21G031700 [Diphasiastrum complanatum]KAJ7517616.1 hypothetical protein O6H91_21G031700 [Diphasiastrum complanatum]